MKIPEKRWKKLRKDYLEQEYFDPEKLLKISAAIGTLADYLTNMEIYFHKKKEVIPKQESLEGAEKKLASVEEILDKKKRALKEITDNVASLKKQLDDSEKQATKLKQEKDTAEVQLVRAEKLLSGLADERVRWEQSEIDLNKDLTNLVGNTLM